MRLIICIILAFDSIFYLMIQLQIKKSEEKKNVIQAKLHYFEQAL